MVAHGYSHGFHDGHDILVSFFDRLILAERFCLGGLASFRVSYFAGNSCVKRSAPTFSQSFTKLLASVNL